MANINLTITNDSVQEISFNSSPVDELYYNGDKVWPNKYLDGFLKFDSPAVNELIIEKDWSADSVYKLYMSLNGGPWTLASRRDDVVLFGGSLGSLRFYGDYDTTNGQPYTSFLSFSQGTSRTGSPITVSGTLLSLYYPMVTEDDTRTMVSERMFAGVTDLHSATGLKMPICFSRGRACANMFAGTNLVYPPDLPAMSLSNECYNRMFAECYLLERAPDLPAVGLVEGCYSNMFLNCKSLTQVPDLPAKTLAKQCYMQMFKGCEALEEAPTIAATVMAYACCLAMFEGCTSLTAAPELPAKVLANDCYNSMFLSCSSLRTTPDLPALNAVPGCYWSMFEKCVSLTSMHMCIINQVDAYALHMLSGCQGIKRIEVDFTGWFGSSSGFNSNFGTKYWVNGAFPTTGTFVKPASVQDIFDTSHIPKGWTVVNK